MNSPPSAESDPPPSVAANTIPAEGKPSRAWDAAYPTRPTRALRLLYPWLRLLLLVLARVFSPKFTVSGTHNVPRRGAVLLAPNHISDCDPPFVQAASPRYVWFMAKEELFLRPLLGPLIRFFGAFPVEPGGVDRQSLRHAGDLLASGQALIIFPEGRLSLDGELAEVLPGVVMLALKSGVPIIPVGIWNTQVVVPYGDLVPRPTLQRVVVHFGEPISFAEFASLSRREARSAAAVRLREAIAAARGAAQALANSPG